MRISILSALSLAVLSAAASAQVQTTTGRSWNWVTTSEAPPAVSPCACSSYKNIWLDVVLVIDISESMTESGLDALSNYFLTAFGRMNIGQGIGHFSRIGAVVYGDEASLMFNLTDFKSYDDMLNYYNPRVDGTKGSNIEAAIRLATAQFESGYQHRSDVKKVIVIAASHYEPGTSEDPKQAAEQFKGNGGQIITLEYVQEHGTTVPILQDLASPYFSLTNRQEDLRADNLLDLFCQANCFCKTNWNPYSLDAQCETPNGGCYFPVTIPASENLAKRYCHGQNATLPKVEDAKKALFLNSQTKNKQEKTWIGLEYSQTSFGYQWQDGSALSSSYQPWGRRDISVSCVAQQQGSGFNSLWYPLDCSEDHLYTCQTTPCSADKYCEQN